MNHQEYRKNQGFLERQGFPEIQEEFDKVVLQGLEREEFEIVQVVRQVCPETREGFDIGLEQMVRQEFEIVQVVHQVCPETQKVGFEFERGPMVHLGYALGLELNCLLERVVIAIVDWLRHGVDKQ